MSTPGFVRPARPGDVSSLARVQVETLRAGYAALFPPPVLESLTADAVAEQWLQSLAAPPTSYHRLFAATEGEVCVGLAAVGPADFDDASEVGAAAGELLLLLVHPSARGRGHGSRLLSAAADSWRGDGRTRGIAWVIDGDTVLRDFLLGAGFGADGALREVEAGSSSLQQARLSTEL